MRRCDYCEAELVGKRPNALYCSDAHRTAAWKAAHPGWRGNGRERQQRPRSPHAGGIQISYRKAVEAMAQARAWMGGVPLRDEHRRWAEAHLSRVLSERQRERL